MALLALIGPFEMVALYTGLVFYLLLGALFAVEFLLRKLWFRFYGDGLADRILARVFPAERTAKGRRSLAYVRRGRERPLFVPTPKHQEVLMPPNAKLLLITSVDNERPRLAAQVVECPAGGVDHRRG